MLGRALHLTETDPSDPNAPAAEDGPDPLEPEIDPEPVLPDETQSASQLPQQFDNYPDADQVPEYALSYFRILVTSGALDGRDGKLLPAAAITRAEICKALVIMRAK